MYHDMTWCEKSRQLQDLLKLTQAELNRKMLNYFPEPMDLFSVAGAMGSQLRWITSSGNGPQRWGQYFLFLDLPLAFITKCISTNWFEESQLDLEESTFYICKET